MALTPDALTYVAGCAVVRGICDLTGDLDKYEEQGSHDCYSLRNTF